VQNAVWLSCIVGTLALFVAQPRWGGLAYILSVMLAPYGVFDGGDVLMRADLVLTPLMLACQFLGLSRTRPNASLVPITWLFVLWLIWIGMATLVSDREFHAVSANGYIRLVMVMIVFSWIQWSGQDVQNFQFAYVLTSIPIGILSVGQVCNISVLRALTEDWYSPPGAVVIELQNDLEQAGYLYRALGVFGNVSPAATYFLLVVCLTVSLLTTAAMRSRRGWLLAALASSILGGISTLSSTFVGGILLAVSIVFFYSDSHRRRKLILAAAGCLAMLALFVALARSEFEMLDAVLEYQWERISSGRFLTARYSSDEGVLAQAFEELRHHPFAGIGWTRTDTFFGDSIYMSLLFCSGMVGCVPLIAGVACLILSAFRNKVLGHWALSWTAIMLLGGIGCTSLLTGRLADGWWAMQGMLISQLGAIPSRQPVDFSHTHFKAVSPARKLKTLTSTN
jgi:hypothetical protein